MTRRCTVSPGDYGLDAAERRRLIEVVNGCPAAATRSQHRAGVEWMRDQARHKGERARF